VVGLLVDRWLGSLPWGTVAGVVVGLVVGIVHLIHLTNQAESPKPPDVPGPDKDNS
jgi:F0F1-type ATP synthase assembly protein I